jgi:hypothetical protein
MGLSKPVHVPQRVANDDREEAIAWGCRTATALERNDHEPD